MYHLHIPLRVKIREMWSLKEAAGLQMTQLLILVVKLKSLRVKLSTNEAQDQLLRGLRYPQVAPVVDLTMRLLYQNLPYMLIET